MSEYPLDYHKGANFTVELGALVESGFDLGLDDYPIFDEEYRAGLNAKIIDHYWFREIGFETAGLFKRFLRRRLSEVMPYYNEVYKTTFQDFDPLANYSQTREGGRKTSATQQQQTDNSSSYASKRDETATSTTTTTTDATGRTVNSTTPQMQLAGNEDYASALVDTASKSDVDGTAANDANSAESGTSTATSNEASASQGVEDYAEKVSGLVGMTAPEAVMRWRQSLVNVDLMVINELDDLFMGLYTDHWNGF